MDVSDSGCLLTIHPESRCVSQGCLVRSAVALKCRFCTSLFHVDCAVRSDCHFFYNNNLTIDSVVCPACKTGSGAGFFPDGATNEQSIIMDEICDMLIDI